jgi:hypothetical protein
VVNALRRRNAKTLTRTTFLSSVNPDSRPPLGLFPKVRCNQVHCGRRRWIKSNGIRLSSFGSGILQNGKNKCFRLCSLLSERVSKGETSSQVLCMRQAITGVQALPDDLSFYFFESILTTLFCTNQWGEHFIASKAKVIMWQTSAASVSEIEIH